MEKTKQKSNSNIPDSPDTNSQLSKVLGRQNESSSVLRMLAASGPLSSDDAPAVFHNLEEMFAQIVHIGKNYLGPIKGYASLIQDEQAEGENSKRWSDKIMHNIDQLEQYFDRLSMLRMRGALTIVDTTWNEIISRAVQKCSFVNRKSAQIEIHIEPTVVFKQRAELLTRVLFQVIRNAVESVDTNGKVIIKVTETRIAGDGGIVREFTVRISDEGSSIEDRNTDIVWKPFFTTKHDHMGLGLPFVAVASPVLGMDVDIQSTSSEGTTVTLVLNEQGDENEA